ncbi:hypothetical protein V2J09_020265, partial [Rumex salicifolius]
DQRSRSSLTTLPKVEHFALRTSHFALCFACSSPENLKNPISFSLSSFPKSCAEIPPRSAGNWRKQRQAMMGTKRRNVSLRSDAEDSAFQSKRKPGDSSFQSQGLASSQQLAVVAPSLDSQRAVSSQQHVRALNTQFASWVQSQLQNHPDELWEDGVQDYLTHASNILEKFSDVVNWLKANTANGGILPSLKAAAAPVEKPQDKVTTSIPETVRPEKSMFGVENKFALPSNSPVLSNSQTSAQSKSPLFSWTSGVTTQNQSPSSNANANANANDSLEASNNSQASGQSATPVFSPWASGVFSTSPSPSSGISASGGASPVTTPWTSGIFSKNTSPPSGTTASAPAPAAWSFGLSSNSQTSFKFGSQSTGPSSEGAAVTTNEDADDENEEQPSSPSVKKTEEKGIVVVHEVKCKLYLKSSDPADKDPWKDKGTGQLSIKCKEGVSKGAKESKPTILVRNDVGRILLNALLYPGIKTTSVKSNSIMAIFHTAAEDGINGNNNEVVARTFLIKTKNEEERNKLVVAIRENTPAA